MENKKVKVVLLGLALVAFLASGCVKQSKIKELKKENGRLNQAIQQKDIQIKTLTDQMEVKQKDLDVIKKELDNSKVELDSVKKELDNTKKELDSVNNKLKTLTAPPAPVRVNK